MSLSGKLEIFPLEEVLRLLARSHQDGCLRVDGEGAGRVYLEGGSLTFATVQSDDVLQADLVAAGLVTEDGLRQVETTHGSLSEALVPSASSAALTELIREHCVESLYRIRRPGAGHFEFQIDSYPRFKTGQSFDIEMLITEAERRAAEWADIETVVSDLGTAWRMVPAIEEESVNLSDTAWRFLAAMDGACSVDVLSSRLGLSNFQTARRMAEMSRARLVEPVTVSRPVSASPETGYAAPVADAYTTLEEPVPAQPEPASDEPKVASRSWWSESDGDVEPAPEPGSGEPAARDESFLETVFSELEQDPTDEAVAEDDAPENDDGDDGGFGLLRRRGLGAAFRELADS